jgi:hypothetical protein
MQGPLINKTGKVLNLFIRDRPALTLKIGDIVKAEVLDITSGNTVSIRLKNTVLKATTDVPLQKNETLMLRVEGRGNEIRLRLVGGGSESTETLRGSILSALNNLKGTKLEAGELGSLSRLIDTLPASVREMLPQLASLKKFFPRIEMLASGISKDVIESSGIFFETKLRLLTLRLVTDDMLQQELQQKTMLNAGAEPDAEKGLARIIKDDLKGTLLSIKGALSDTGVIEHLSRNNIKPDNLNTAIDKLIKNIEYFQLQSRLNDSLQVFIPLIWKDLRDGELIFRESYRGKPEERAYSCIVNLDLEGTGRIMAHILMQSGRFHVRFITENRVFVEVLKEGLPVLEKQFKASGLKVGSISAKHEEKADFSSAISEGLDIKV